MFCCNADLNLFVHCQGLPWFPAIAPWDPISSFGDAFHDAILLYVGSMSGAAASAAETIHFLRWNDVDIPTKPLVLRSFYLTFTYQRSEGSHPGILPALRALDFAGENFLIIITIHE
jgi:hypothetical protein